MNQPWVYMYSPSRSPHPPPTPPAPSRSSHCTRSERLSHASNLGWIQLFQKDLMNFISLLYSFWDNFIIAFGPNIFSRFMLCLWSSLDIIQKKTSHSLLSVLQCFWDFILKFYRNHTELSHALLGFCCASWGNSFLLKYYPEDLYVYLLKSPIQLLHWKLTHIHSSPLLV